MFQGNQYDADWMHSLCSDWTSFVRVVFFSFCLPNSGGDFVTNLSRQHGGDRKRPLWLCVASATAIDFARQANGRTHTHTHKHTHTHEIRCPVGQQGDHLVQLEGIDWLPQKIRPDNAVMGKAYDLTSTASKERLEQLRILHIYLISLVF